MSDNQPAEQSQPEPAKEAEPPKKLKLYGGYATKEEMEREDALFEEEMRLGGEEWERKHGKDARPKVY